MHGPMNVKLKKIDVIIILKCIEIEWDDGAG
jgi:hypothetical protein